MIQANDDTLKERFNLSNLGITVRKRFNIAPTQDVYAILNRSPDTLSAVRWGLIPHWAKDPAIGNKMINARAESLTEKPSFRKPIQSQRCLIIADGFYEWKREGNSKRPFRIMLKDKSLFALAGIWDIWIQDKHKFITCSIITTEANDLVRKIHDRMPVILKREDEEKWLADTAPSAVLGMLRPYNADEMTEYEISTLINSPANDREEVTYPAQKDFFR